MNGYEYSSEDFGHTRAIKWTSHPVKFAPRGALLFCLRGSTTGRLNLCHADLSIGRGVAALVTTEDEQFFVYAMMALRGHLKATFRGSTFPSVTSGHLDNYRLPKPPREEQVVIAENIAQQTAIFDSAIVRARREIDLMQEYRTRLVADVVSGKADVRHVPPDTGEAVPYHTEALDEGDEAFGDEFQDTADLEPVEEVANADD